MNRLYLLLILLLGCKLLSYGQTQAPNPGFENWPGISTSSPAGWHSYDESAGIFAGAASNKSGNPPALERVSGHSGKYACVIRCNKILGVAANGALTTGRVYMGAMGASSPKNYCYSDRQGGYAWRFTGRPDSMYLWAKFKMSGDVCATAKAHLHTDCDFRDFVDVGQKSDVASAIMYIKDRGKGGWHQYKQAFKAYSSPQKATAEQAPMPTVSDWTRRPNYLLLSFSTNRYVMKGTKGDALYIDDIRMVYNKALSSIQIGGDTIPGFDKAVLNYNYFCFSDNQVFPEVFATTESPRAEIVIEQATANHPVAIITVFHDDVFAGEAEPRVYTVYFINTRLLSNIFQKNPLTNFVLN